MNKPIKVMTTMRDPEGRRTVADVMIQNRGKAATRLVPVGRLDFDSSGVLLMTNDGDLAHALTHPKFEVEKVYRATVRGRLDATAVARMGEGVKLDDKPAAPVRIKVVATARDRSVIDLTLHEGRYREVRRIFEAVGHEVVTLERLRFGPVSLGDLAPGTLRAPTDRESRELDAILRNSREEE